MPLKKRVPIDLEMDEWRELCRLFPDRSLASVLMEMHRIGKAVMIAQINSQKKESVS